MRSYEMSDKVKLGTKIKTDPAPGAFLTADDIKETMLEQRRAFVGGMRTYGQEYDDYYQDRRWDLASKPPSFSPEGVGAFGQAAPSSQYLTPEDLNRAYLESGGCPTPGAMIRSRGMGRGLARGGGRGPMGVPVAEKLAGVIRGMGSLGAEEKVLPPAETVDIVTAVREIYGTVVDLKPLLSFLGEYPVGTIALVLLVVGVGAAIGGAAGAGMVDVLRAKWKLAK